MSDGKNKKAVKGPNFFIVGAAKSGTTSLADNLRQHPQVFMSPLKEPAYFVKDEGNNDFDEYVSLFKDAGDAIAIGEATTGYLFDEDAPYAIKEHFPDAKIIIILRNPVDMAYSYWRYTRGIGGNESKSFEQAISANEIKYRNTEEFRRKAINWWGSYLYLERASYYGQVKRYLDVFGRDRVMVYIFEEFIKSHEVSYKDIFTFLGVDTDFTPDFRVSNEGVELRSEFIKKLLLFNHPFLKRLLKRLMPVEHWGKIKAFLSKINIKKGVRREMKPETRKRLEAFFREDIRMLEGLLGREIQAWKPKPVAPI